MRIQAFINTLLHTQFSPMTCNCDYEKLHAPCTQTSTPDLGKQATL